MVILLTLCTLFSIDERPRYLKLMMTTSRESLGLEAFSSHVWPPNQPQSSISLNKMSFHSPSLPSGMAAIPYSPRFNPSQPACLISPSGSLPCSSTIISPTRSALRDCFTTQQFLLLIIKNPICTPRTDSNILALLPQDETGGLKPRNITGE